MNCSTPGFPVLHHFLGFAQTHVHWVSDAIQPSHPLSSPSPPSFNLSSIRVFSTEMALCIMWPRYWSFSIRISTSNEYTGLISFRIDWLDLLAVQRTFKSYLQHHSSKASVLHHSDFFVVQFSHLYMTTGKNIALTIQTFVGKVMSLILYAVYFCHCFTSKEQVSFNFKTAQWPSTVNLELKKIKSVSASVVSPSISHEVIGPDSMILVFWMLSFTPAFSLSSFTFIKRFYNSSLLSLIKEVSSAYMRLLVCHSQSGFQLVLHPAWHFTWCTQHIS